jgi:hypothetical protein
MEKNLIYDIHDKPKFGNLLLFALQQVLAILAATILVPAIIGNGMSQSAALFGAGVGTLVYQLFTKFRSPVFLGSSFAFNYLFTTNYSTNIFLFYHQRREIRLILKYWVRCCTIGEINIFIVHCRINNIIVYF